MHWWAGPTWPVQPAADLNCRTFLQGPSYRSAHSQSALSSEAHGAGMGSFIQGSLRNPPFHYREKTNCAWLSKPMISTDEIWIRFINCFVSLHLLWINRTSSLPMRKRWIAVNKKIRNDYIRNCLQIWVVIDHAFSAISMWTLILQGRKCPEKPSQPRHMLH